MKVLKTLECARDEEIEARGFLEDVEACHRSEMGYLQQKSA